MLLNYKNYLKFKIKYDTFFTGLSQKKNITQAPNLISPNYSTLLNKSQVLRNPPP